MRDDVKWAGLFGGGGVGFRVTHTLTHTQKHTNPLIVLFEAATKQRGEKGPLFT